MKTIVVIGAGIIGSFIAREGSQYEVKVIVIEKHHDVCEEVSAGNSAIVHAGYDPLEGTLKGLLNKRGADLYPDICAGLHVDYKRCGALVVASGEDEEQTLEELYQRGIHRGVEMNYLSTQEAFKKENNLSDTISKVMEVPNTAIITPWDVSVALMDECLLNGVELHLAEEVIDIKVQKEGCMVITNKGSYPCDMVINAAGLGAEKIMNMTESTSLFTITPKRGQYYVLSKKANDFVHEIIYPVPSKLGKGVLAIPTVHGNTLLGPNSEVLTEEDTSTTSEGLKDVKEHLTKTLKNVPFQEVIHTYSGLRPAGNNGDFFIQASPTSDQVVHVACIDSPGLASAPAIGEYVLQEFILKKLNCKRKGSYHHRQGLVRMRDHSLLEKQALIHQTPAYGHIICRCEEISEQEVVDCIHEPCGATSIKGVKKRVRPGMGKCQGGFCEVEVAKILARELKIPEAQVKYDSDAYFIVNNKGGRK